MPASPPLNPKTARLLSNMGYRTSRRSGNRTFHAGMDIGSREGEGALVTAVQGGVVEHVLSDDDGRPAFRGYGNGVVVDHGDGTWALYAHLLDVAPGLAPGQRVEAGQPLGRMGRTSNNTFRTMGVPHLHLELRRAKPDGSSPFPGAYGPMNLDPAEWMSAKGMRFVRRGGLEIDRDSEMEASRPTWESVHPYTMSAPGLGQVKPSALPSAGPGQARSKPGVSYQFTTPNAYEPVRFDRDVWVGLPPWAWAMIGTGVALGSVLAIVALVRAANRG